MRKILSFFLTLCILLSGCSPLGNYISEPVRFHYLCSRYQEDLCCVINSEEREAVGHSGDLNYLLALYLMGPIDDELKIPLPPGTKVISVQQNEDIITLQLPDLDSTLSDIDFSLACACLTMTCLNISNATSVTVLSGSRSVTMDSSSYALSDSSMETIPKES